MVHSILIIINNNHNKNIDFIDGNKKFIYCNDLFNYSDLHILLNNIDLMVITGGMQHIYEIDKYPELLLEMKLIDICIEKNIKIIGICLGFQLINHYFGNKIIKLDKLYFQSCLLDKHSLNYDVINNDNYLKNINFDLLSKSISVHYDGLYENTNNDIDIIAKSIYGHIYFIKHKKYPIYGIQSHHEASIETINNCITRLNYNGEIELFNQETYKNIQKIFFQHINISVS